MTIIITTKLLLIQSDLVSLSLTIALPKAYCTFGNCKLVFFRTRVDRYGGALVVLGMSENPGKPSFRSPNGLLAPFLA